MLLHEFIEFFIFHLGKFLSTFVILNSMIFFGYVYNDILENIISKKS